MISAYKKIDIDKLELFETAKTLKKEGFIDANAALLELEVASVLYHPGWIMRILLFITGYIGLSGVTGMALLMLQDLPEDAWKTMLIIVGGIGVLINELLLVRGLQHFKSGLTEVVLYNSVGMIAGGFVLNFQHSEVLAALFVVLTCLLAAIRYLDKTTTMAAAVAFAFFLFFLFFKIGGVAEKMIPFVIVIAFGAWYFISVNLEKREKFALWLDQIHVLQVVSLILAYLGANYFVVRELGQEMLGMHIEPGKDIAFAWFFYLTTVLIPLVYLYFGVKNRNRILLWVGLVILGFSVFTFKYYYSSGHPEITVTLAGAILLAVSVYLLNKLKKPINGITRERLGVSDLDSLTAEGIFISQTVGGITTGQQEGELFQGGDFGGGGASGNF